jgi:hypothetical protein
MPASKGSWGARRITQCQVCKRWVRRNTLRMMAHDRLIPGPGANHLLYSRYQPDYWSCTSTLEAMDSIGVEDTRVKYEPQNYGYVVENPITLAGSTFGEAHSLVNAAPAFLGSGTLRTSAALDVSGWTNVMFAIWVGYHQRDPHYIGTAEVGLCSDTGTNLQAVATFAVTGSRFVWFTLPVARINGVLGTNVCPYVTFTTNNGLCWWWSDDAQLEDALVPGIYYQTAGAAVVYATDTWIRMTARTCPRCREKLFDLGKLRGRPRQEADLPVPLDKWEEG